MCIIANVINMNGNRRVENRESRERGDEMLYSIVMSNKQMVGNKSHAYIPLKLCAADPSYQRTENISWSKVTRLANNWDNHLMDEITVVPHPDENLFYVIDGWHRVLASNMIGNDSICAEIITDLSTDPKTRQKQEAEIFSKQNAFVDKLSAKDLHKAGIVAENKIDLQLNDLIKKYGFTISSKRSGKGNPNEIMSIASIVRMFKYDNGYNLIDNTFYVIVASGWNHEKGGITKNMFSTIRMMFALHPKFEADIRKSLVEILRPMSIKDAVAFATVEYPRRSESTRLGIWLEDRLVEKIPEMKPVYKRIPSNTGYKNGTVA